jgi:catechol 2,3-dioxygenase-like lactoylglutathione lyase family enzyme
MAVGPSADHSRQPTERPLHEVVPDNVESPSINSPLAVLSLNHLTFAVSDLERSVAFYSELLGFAVRMHGPSSAYLEAGTLWLALVQDPETRRGPLSEYTHIAFGVDASQLQPLATQLTSAGVTQWQKSEDGSSFYFLDPDGHKLELHSGDLTTRLAVRAGLLGNSTGQLDNANSSLRTEGVNLVSRP